MSLCDNEDLRISIRDKVTAISQAMAPDAMTQEVLDLFLELEDLIAEAFEPEDDED